MLPYDPAHIIFFLEDAMSTLTKLVVGQYVNLESGVYAGAGKVVKITALGVEVQMSDKLRQFDNNGRSYLPESDPSYNPLVRPDSPLRCDGTIECGPWIIADDLDNIAKARLERLHHEMTGKRKTR
jgi:hypothetical protein